MWNPKKLWRASAVSAAVLLGRIPGRSLWWHRRQGGRSRPKPARPLLVDETPNASRARDAHSRRRMLLGCPGCVSARPRRHECELSGYDGGAASTSAQCEVVSTRYPRGMLNRSGSHTILTSSPTAVSAANPPFSPLPWIRRSSTNNIRDEGTQYRSEIFCGDSRAGPDCQRRISPSSTGPRCFCEGDRHEKSGRIQGSYPAEAYHTRTS